MRAALLFLAFSIVADGFLLPGAAPLWNAHSSGTSVRRDRMICLADDMESRLMEAIGAVSKNMARSDDVKVVIETLADHGRLLSSIDRRLAELTESEARRYAEKQFGETCAKVASRGSVTDMIHFIPAELYSNPPGAAPVLLRHMELMTRVADKLV
eukprot:TRINITY_DN2243_c1_g1_i1.p2 TRINITY_DN2243_c1_g1~~TRINITY_DN2243_c1_g1_i1.p2  ORF type:complete len:156 (+),score=26.37 TRINITY_DN2243_c1_g1_i1:439-906(+)